MASPPTVLPRVGDSRLHQGARRRRCVASTITRAPARAPAATIQRLPDVAAERHRLHLDLVVDARRPNLRLALELGDRALRHEQRARHHCRLRRHAPVLAGPQHDASDSGTAALMRMVPVLESICRSAARNAPVIGYVRAVGERQLQRGARVPQALAPDRPVDLIRDVQVFRPRSARSTRGSDRPATPSSAAWPARPGRRSAPWRSPRCRRRATGPS